MRAPRAWHTVGARGELRRDLPHSLCPWAPRPPAPRTPSVLPSPPVSPHGPCQGGRSPVPPGPAACHSRARLDLPRARPARSATPRPPALLCCLRTRVWTPSCARTQDSAHVGVPARVHRYMHTRARTHARPARTRQPPAAARSAAHAGRPGTRARRRRKAPPRRLGMGRGSRDRGRREPCGPPSPRRHGQHPKHRI